MHIHVKRALARFNALDLAMCSCRKIITEHDIISHFRQSMIDHRLLYSAPINCREWNVHYRTRRVHVIVREHIQACMFGPNVADQNGSQLDCTERDELTISTIPWLALLRYIYVAFPSKVTCKSDLNKTEKATKF